MLECHCEAVTIVWIASQFTDEHRATMTWLNSITDERFKFFALEIELWKIGTSSPASLAVVHLRPESAFRPTNPPSTPLHDAAAFDDVGAVQEAGDVGVVGFGDQHRLPLALQLFEHVGGLQNQLRA